MLVRTTTFNEGIVNDPRLPREAVCRVSTNFDILTNPRKMTPYKDSESGDSAAATSQKQNFCLALRTGTTYSIYSLGVKSGASTAEVLYKDLTTGAANDLDDAAWTNTANNQSSAGATNFNLFVFYKQTALIYGARAGTHIWAYDPAGAIVFADTSHALTYTNIAQGIVHSKDDILYIPYDNKIATNNNGSWTDAALTLPTHYKINSICEYNDYLAIAAAPLSGIGNSRVYLWDRNSSLTTVSESIDWGEGELKVLEELEGILIGISISKASTTQAIRFDNRITFKYYSSTYGAVKFNELLSSTTGTTVLHLAKQKADNRLYFMAQMYLNGAQRDGVWSVGRTSVDVPLAVSHERTPNNDTAITNLYNFFVVGDYMFQSYDTGGTFGLSKTNDASSYTATSIRETEINPNMREEDRPKTKQLMAVKATYEPLPANGQVVLKYRVDSSGSYTTIFTETTDNAVKSAELKDGTGAEFAKGTEYEFRIESTGGAVVTGLEYIYQVHKEKFPYAA